MDPIADTLETLTVGETLAHENLALFPLVGALGSLIEYVTLDEALASGSARVTEVSSGGSVPELSFANEGETAVFLLDGEELIGAKQNRILNLSMLVAPKSTVAIPVSCVESGRWAYSSDQFSSSRHAHFSRGRASKAASVSANMRESGARFSNQSEVWADVDTRSADLGVQSPTSAISDVFASHEADLEAFVEQIQPDADHAGAVFCIGGSIAGMDIFDKPQTFAKLTAKLVRSYGLDAIDGNANRPPTREKIEEFLGLVGATKPDVHPAVGLGQDLRLSVADLSGGGLELDSTIIHLCAFPKAQDGGIGSRYGARGARMARASDRRR
jgi:hypothetical protein